MIEVRGLVKSFGSQVALRAVDLDVAKGERLALVGPNGAGKTTLVRVLAGLSRPEAGSVRIAGLDMAQPSARVRRCLGFVSHQPLVYDSLSAEENLRFYGNMYDVVNLERRITELMDRVGLQARRHDLVRTYSRGMRQRLAIARALLHDPSVLLLDEPCAGLDEEGTEMLGALLRKMAAASGSVLLTTHSLVAAWRLGHRVAILVNGQIRGRTDVGRRGLDSFRAEYRRQTAGGGG